ncbi:MAG TPA: PRC-barrel domain-containing protein [Solirubrobacterales bacterium]|nr:PRC-barrel domain-containing protein [Solirubrobacterales bacterium]
MPEPLALPEAIGWVGGPLADLEGEEIGEVQSVYIDSTSHQPAWLVAKLSGGRRGRGARIVAVPVDVCAGAAGVGVWAAVDGSKLRGAPVVDPTRPLLREHELTICEHFGITGDLGRAGNVARLAEGAITAIPPRS